MHMDADDRLLLMTPPALDLADPWRDRMCKLAWHIDAASPDALLCLLESIRSARAVICAGPVVSWCCSRRRQTEQHMRHMDGRGHRQVVEAFQQAGWIACDYG